MHGPLTWVLNLICVQSSGILTKRKKKSAPLDDDFLGDLGSAHAFY